MIAGFSKRAVLRAGYGAILVVLVLSAFEAYRIQIGISERHLETYRQYDKQEEALSTLRRNLFLAGGYVRDFFIITSPAQARILRAQLDDLRKEDDQALAYLAGTPGQGDTIPGLRRTLGEFWNGVDSVPETMLHLSDPQKFDFVQRVIVPRRGELYAALRDITAADQQRLQESAKEFAEARRRAAARLLAMLAASLLLSFLVARLSLRHAENLERKADRNFAEVERAKRELQQLSARLLEIEEEGRRKLSRELHDEIGQALALLQIEISRAQGAAASPESLREHLRRARELAEKTVQSIRDITGMLRPALLDDLGLAPALQFQLEDFLRRSGIACDFSEDGLAGPLPDAVKTCVYRVVQEALHNCEKHSGATSVRVAVRQLPGALAVEIEDNGCGFQLDERRMPTTITGHGLLGIRERAAMARGSLDIESAPGKGTRIALRIPLEEAPASQPALCDGVTA